MISDYISISGIHCLTIYKIVMPLRPWQLWTEDICACYAYYAYTYIHEPKSTTWLQPSIQVYIKIMDRGFPDHRALLMLTVNLCSFYYPLIACYSIMMVATTIWIYKSIAIHFDQLIYAFWNYVLVVLQLPTSLGVSAPRPCRWIVD